MPETWFFRDPEAFAALARLAREEWLPGHPEGVLRLLSLPCSTGEEPYSMAMALLDAGFPAKRFTSTPSTSAHARWRGPSARLYGRNSFRGNDLGFRDRHFEPTANGYRLAETVRGRCIFSRATCLPPAFCPARSSTT